mmetsp:Transcript_81825/g.159712  ORF Transcript_81825/g.159712 Transcript_81825/m.159712 type:complete len:88 (+) Transcript_81825:120-383(+)
MRRRFPICIDRRDISATLSEPFHHTDVSSSCSLMKRGDQTPIMLLRCELRIIPQRLQPSFRILISPIGFYFVYKKFIRHKELWSSEF